MITRLLVSAILLTMLSACSLASQAALAGINLVSYVHTDKTLTDHAISLVTDENCSIRHSANNEPYCQPLPENGDLATAGDANPDAPPTDWDPGQLANGAPIFCYRTLGGVSCYEEPDPSASAYAAMQ